MTARPELTAELKRLVLAVEDDLRARLEQETSVKAAWQDEHRRALSAQRTGSVWETSATTSSPRSRSRGC